MQIQKKTPASRSLCWLSCTGNMITNLNTIAAAAVTNENGNVRFKEMVQSSDSATIDQLVFKLNDTITPQIDCTQCGNCCRSLMINVEAADAGRLSKQLDIPEETFYERYIERSNEGTLAVMSSIPCHFLFENKCTVYEARPNECREFPGLHHPGFKKRLFAIFMHYGRCPIIFNVIEQLKLEMEFK